MHCHVLGHEDLMMMINFDPTLMETPDDSPIAHNYAPPAFNPYVHHPPHGIDTTDITNGTEFTTPSRRKPGQASGGQPRQPDHRGHSGHGRRIREAFALALQTAHSDPRPSLGNIGVQVREDSLIAGGNRQRPSPTEQTAMGQVVVGELWQQTISSPDPRIGLAGEIPTPGWLTWLSPLTSGDATAGLPG
jgi:hypothetical protein